VEGDALGMSDKQGIYCVLQCISLIHLTTSGLQTGKQLQFSFSTVIQTLWSALTQFISFNGRLYLQLVVMYVPRTLDENLVAVVSLLQIPKEGGEIWGDWSTKQTLLDLSTRPWWSFAS